MNTTEPTRTWKYEYTHIRIVDGDTTVGDIDQGMNVWSRSQYIRFAGINAPERETPEGQQAKQYLATLMSEGQLFYIVTNEYHEFEKYGRVLAYLYTDPSLINHDNLLEGSINQQMLDSGNAKPYSGEGPKP